jgi:hypothetical protein
MDRPGSRRIYGISPRGKPWRDALSRGGTAEWAAAHSFTRHASAMPRFQRFQAGFGSQMAANEKQHQKKQQ